MNHTRVSPSPWLLYVGTLGILALASLLDTFVGYHQSGRAGLFYLWMPYPGFDFVDYTLQFPYLHTQQFFTLPQFPWVYPAPAIFVLYPFYKFASATSRIAGFALFSGCIVAADLLLAWRFRRALINRGMRPRDASAILVANALLGWPLYFSLQRGNIESLLWMGMAVGAVFFFRNRFTTAAIVWGMVGSAKLYPLVFLALFLHRRLYRPLLLGIAAAIATTLAGLRFLEPNVLYAYRQIQDGVAKWTAITTASYPAGGIGTDHSLLGLLRQCTLGAIVRPTHALTAYLALAGTTLALIYLLRVRQLPAFNQLLYLSCVAILLPPTSFDYTLLLLLVPWGWLLVFSGNLQDPPKVATLRTPLLLFSFALAPLSFLHTHGTHPVFFEGPVRCIAILALLVYAACYAHEVRPATSLSEPRLTEQAP